MLTQSKDDKNINLFNGIPMDFVLPRQGKSEVFSFRWNRIGES